MPVETRYHRSDQHVINTLTARKLLTSRSGVSGQIVASASPDTTFWVSDVFIRASGGTEVQIGSNVAPVSRNATGQGIQSNTFVCPETVLLTTDAVVIREKITNNLFQTLGSATGPFITEQLGAVLLSNVTWTIYRYTTHELDPSEGNVSTLQFDTATFNTRIENFTWNVSTVKANNLFFCNG